MKTFSVLLPIFTLAAVGYGGQTNQVDLPQRGSPPAAPSISRPAAPATSSQSPSITDFRTNSSQPFFRSESNYGGVLPDLRRKKAQFFRPSAEPYSPAAFHNVSIDPHTGQADGIILFSIKF